MDPSEFPGVSVVNSPSTNVNSASIPSFSASFPSITSSPWGLFQTDTDVGPVNSKEKSIEPLSDVQKSNPEPFSFSLPHKRISSQEISTTSEGLHTLASQGSWRAVVEKTKEALGKGGNIDHELVLRAYHVLALVKLRMYGAAADELQVLGDLNAAEYQYENTGLYLGKSGSMLPFVLRWIHAELPHRLGQPQLSLDRYYALLSYCNAQLDVALRKEGSREALKKTLSQSDSRPITRPTTDHQPANSAEPVQSRPPPASPPSAADILEDLLSGESPRPSESAAPTRNPGVLANQGAGDSMVVSRAQGLDEDSFDSFEGVFELGEESPGADIGADSDEEFFRTFDEVRAATPGKAEPSRSDSSSFPSGFSPGEAEKIPEPPPAPVPSEEAKDEISDSEGQGEGSVRKEEGMEEREEGEESAEAAKWRRRYEIVSSAVIGRHVARREFAAVVRWMEDLAQRGPSDPLILTKCGMVQLQMGDLKGAQITFSKVESLVKKKKKTSTGEREKLEGCVLKNRGLLLFAQKQYSEAMAEFDASLVLDPTDFVSVNNKALCLMYSKDLVGAVKVLEDALQSSPFTALNETLVRNLCSMYELASVNSVESKQRLSNWITRVARDDFDMMCTRL